ncbi:MAG: J domain-containing protein, partial [Opitutaceae bacterium]
LAPVFNCRMPDAETNHYATLGLDRRCTVAQVRSAYRLLVKRHDPDVNGGAADAVEFSRLFDWAEFWPAIAH